jgi:hypothetical protein
MTRVADPVVYAKGSAWPCRTAERAAGGGGGGATAAGRGGIATCCLGAAGRLCVAAGEGAVRVGGFPTARLAAGKLVSNAGAVVVGTGLIE